MQLLASQDVAKIVVGNRIPRNFFITSGTGQSDIDIHAGSFHLALKDAGIESYNIINYSSILPGIASEVPRPNKYVHGSVLETIIANATSRRGQRATAGIIFGWLFDKRNGSKYGGIVCEYNGQKSEQDAGEQLMESINELYVNGYDDQFNLKDIRLITTSFVPEKKFGSSLVALCFTDYVFPVVPKE